MALTFIFGNGFDLNLGLKTGYGHFRDVYLREYRAGSIKDPILKMFMRDMDTAQEYKEDLWRDFEKALGIRSIIFEDGAKLGDDQALDLIHCYNDYSVKFADYLSKLCDDIDMSKFDDMKKADLINSIVKFYDCIDDNEQNGLKAELKQLVSVASEINFLQFNYTNVFDRLLEDSGMRAELGRRRIDEGVSELKDNVQIHGKLGDSMIVMGLDSIEQIANEKIRENILITNAIVKPVFINELRNDNEHPGTERARASAVILRSTVICIFGSSIGETDNTWWVEIGEWLIKDDKNRLIIFGQHRKRNRATSGMYMLSKEEEREKKRAILNNFLSQSGLSPVLNNGSIARVAVVLNHSLFGSLRDIFCNHPSGTGPTTPSLEIEE